MQYASTIVNNKIIYIYITLLQYFIFDNVTSFNSNVKIKMSNNVIFSRRKYKFLYYGLSFTQTMRSLLILLQ